MAGCSVDPAFSYATEFIPVCLADRPDLQTVWGCPDSVDSDQGLAVVSVRAAMYCCS